jgi:hypothetical protein
MLTREECVLSSLVTFLWVSPANYYSGMIWSGDFTAQIHQKIVSALEA